MSKNKPLVISSQYSVLQAVLMLLIAIIRFAWATLEVWFFTAIAMLCSWLLGIVGCDGGTQG